MRRAQESAPLSRRAKGAGRWSHAVPENARVNVLTFVSAMGILLAGFLAAVNLDRLLPSGKDVVTASGSRSPLDESWLRDGSEGEPLGIFPYDLMGDARLAPVDDEALPAALEGVQILMALCEQMTGQWVYGSNGRPLERVWDNRYKTTDLTQYLNLGEVSAMLQSDEWTTSARSAVTVEPGDTASSLGDVQYAGILHAAMPGLSSPDRWLVYRIPVMGFLEKSDEAISYLYVADAVYHPARGLVHLFVHEPGQSFPSSFTPVKGGVALQYIKAQSAQFLETLQYAFGQVKGAAAMDKKVGRPWRSDGNLRMIDTEGVVSAEAQACYFAGDLCAVSFPHEMGGRILLYMDTATMNIRGFSRLHD